MRWLLLLGLSALVYWWKGAQQGNKRMPPKRPRPSPASAMTRTQARKVLKIGNEADEVEIKQAYQKLVSQYHPDRVANAAPELQELAERRTKELNAAFAVMKGGSSQPS